MVPNSKTWIQKFFFYFFGRVSKVWKIPQSLNLDIIFWDFTDTLLLYLWNSKQN